MIRDKPTGQADIPKKADASLRRHLRQRLRAREGLDQLTEVLAAAGYETRLHVLFLLSQYDELCVSDLAEILGVSVSALSQQLRILRERGLLCQRREQQMIFYRLSDSPLCRSLMALLNFSATATAN